ncbi:gata transcription factor 24 [Phtheirospermum japonicum]|uniref:Gata transcription factor 24 n=1 Tax=Phtheirospermum japonicum TaxID=374723 RepID=A0A830BGW5_9LAMI|nr:gata transcription factor 24 [Phtheirospermum japonicum]
MNDTTADHLRHHHLRHHQDTTHIDEEEDENDVATVLLMGDEPLENPPSHIGYDPRTTLTRRTRSPSWSPPSRRVDPTHSTPRILLRTRTPQSGKVAPTSLPCRFRVKFMFFDSVSPEKVQAVLLLLGGYEVPPTGIPTPGMTPQNPRNVGDYPARSSQPERAASLNRFREKRKERCFEKKIRYTVRKEVALR